MYYETKVAPNFKIQRFISAFDLAIGTDREINKVDAANSTCLCMELEGDEVEKCRQLENALL